MHLWSVAKKNNMGVEDGMEGLRDAEQISVFLSMSGELTDKHRALWKT